MDELELRYSPVHGDSSQTQKSDSNSDFDSSVALQQKNLSLSWPGVVRWNRTWNGPEHSITEFE